MSQKCSVSTTTTFTRPHVNQLVKKDKRGRKKKYQLKKLIEVCSLVKLKDPNLGTAVPEKHFMLQPGQLDLSASAFRRSEKKEQLCHYSSLSEDEESELEVLGQWDVIGRRNKKQKKWEKQIFPPGFRVSKKGVDDSLCFFRKLKEERHHHLKTVKKTYSQLSHSSLKELLARVPGQNS